VFRKNEKLFVRLTNQDLLIFLEGRLIQQFCAYETLVFLASLTYESCNRVNSYLIYIIAEKRGKEIQE